MALWKLLSFSVCFCLFFCFFFNWHPGEKHLSIWEEVEEDVEEGDGTDSPRGVFAVSVRNSGDSWPPPPCPFCFATA